MKNSLLAIVLAAATMPFAFAATQATEPPATNSPAAKPPAATDTVKTKKAVKKHHKKHMTNKKAAETTPANPSGK